LASGKEKVLSKLSNGLNIIFIHCSSLETGEEIEEEKHMRDRGNDSERNRKRREGETEGKIQRGESDGKRQRGRDSGEDIGGEKYERQMERTEGKRQRGTDGKEETERKGRREEEGNEEKGRRRGGGEGEKEGRGEGKGERGRGTRRDREGERKRRGGSYGLQFFKGTEAQDFLFVCIKLFLLVPQAQRKASLDKFKC
jgi:hypothetical protein